MTLPKKSIGQEAVQFSKNALLYRGMPQKRPSRFPKRPLHFSCRTKARLSLKSTLLIIVRSNMHQGLTNHSTLIFGKPAAIASADLSSVHLRGPKQQRPRDSQRCCDMEAVLL